MMPCFFPLCRLPKKIKNTLNRTGCANFRPTTRLFKSRHVNWREQRPVTRKARQQQGTYTVRHCTVVDDHVLGIITAMKGIHWLEKEELPPIRSSIALLKKQIFR